MRAHNFKDLSGRIFGRWIVSSVFEVRVLKNRKRVTFWKCRCSCGIEKFVRSAQLVFGVSTGCKACGTFRKPEGVSARNAGIGRYKQEARERNLSWDLSDEFFFKVTAENCYYCDASPNNVIRLPHGNGDFVYNGIDRIDNCRGYEIDNVVPCCRKCNRAKDVMSREDFLSWIERIYQHRKTRRIVSP